MSLKTNIMVTAIAWVERCRLKCRSGHTKVVKLVLATIVYRLALVLSRHSVIPRAHLTLEPRHDKTNKMSVRPAKTQISLGIRPV